MTITTKTLAVLSILGLWSHAGAQVAGGFSPVPLWPLSGEPSKEVAEGHYVFFEPETGHFVVHYPAELGGPGAASGKKITFRVELQNLVKPAVSVDISNNNDGKFRYQYTIQSLANSKRPISTWSFVAASTDDSIQLSHPVWASYADTRNKPAVASQTALLNGPELKRESNMGKFVRWSTPVPAAAVAVGAALNNFVAVSDHKPGWTTAFVGGGDGIRLPHDVPSVVKAQLEILQRPENYFSQALVIGPKFGPGVSDQWIAADWHLGIERLLIEKRLASDSPFVQEVLSILRTVAEANGPISATLRAKPAGALEAQIAAALRFSLNIQ